jgi:hypothetical protein
MKNNKVLICAISVCALILCMAAGVNGIFNSVTSTHGYMVGGSAGSSGQTICSDGTYFNTPCFLYYQTIQENTTPLAQQPVLNFDGTVVASAGSGKTNVGLPNVGTAGTYTGPIAMTVDAQGRVQSISTTTAIGRTCNGYGCYWIDQYGTIEERVNTVVPNNSVASVTLPHVIPTAVMSITCTDNSSRVQSGNNQAIGANVAGLGAPFSTFYINSLATGVNAYCAISGY